MQGDALTMINSIFPFIIMGGVFYFMLWRPQKQEQKKRQEMLESLKIGDDVITLGGIIGKITKIDDREVTLKVAENVEMQFLRTAIGHIKTE
ncbi:MAG: preprotein translocase subunit YajC [Phascolarctobacterium sp.]|nr:preprotein translocase subunit YajC [Phascolarctobacterium sp.]